jgi:hypothetical protein
MLFIWSYRCTSVTAQIQHILSIAAVRKKKKRNHIATRLLNIQGQQLKHCIKNIQIPGLPGGILVHDSIPIDLHD